MSKDKYCACINKENIYRYFSSQAIAIRRFKRIAIDLNGNLTDISVKLENKWSRIRWI